MKYVKMLGLLAVAAAALMAFAGPASATLTEAPGDPVDVGDTIKASSTHTQLDGTINITCASSTVEGTVNSNGANHAAGTINSLTFTQCGNHTVTVNKPGSLTITDSNNTTGTLFSSGAEVTVLTHSIFLGTRHCIYVTNNTHIGTVTSSTSTATAKLTIDSAPIPQSATDSLCGNDAEWTGSYTINQPHALHID